MGIGGSLWSTPCAASAADNPATAVHIHIHHLQIRAQSSFMVWVRATYCKNRTTPTQSTIAFSVKLILVWHLSEEGTGAMLLQEENRQQPHARRNRVRDQDIRWCYLQEPEMLGHHKLFGTSCVDVLYCTIHATVLFSHVFTYPHDMLSLMCLY